MALITGAGGGIGKATARLFAAQGARVIATDIDPAAAQHSAATIAEDLGTDGRAAALAHDVTSETDWTAAIDRAGDTFGRLDIVVNNAGVALHKSIEETTLEEWRGVQAVNLDGVFLGTRCAIVAMKETGGAIVNLSSVAGIVGNADLAAYGASKAGVRLLTKSAALHCARAGYDITVNSVHPGYVRTPLLEASVARRTELERGLAELADLHPIGRLGTVDEIARAILYAASPHARFMTGAELVIDGGLSAR